jgi:hypothetical protein
MALNLTQRLIGSHLVGGNMQPGNEIALRIDQALLQDVLGTLVMLELEAMGVERIQIDTAAQYIDHNLLETDNLNGDEHLFCVRLAAGSASGTAARATASVTRCTCSGSVSPAKRSSAQTATPPLPAAWECWHSVPAVWMSRWCWPASLHGLVHQLRRHQLP